MTNKEWLEKTKEILNTKGWTVGTFKSEDGFCLMGAGVWAKQPWDEDDIPSVEVERDFQELMGWERNGTFVPLFTWNDTRNSKEEVIELIDAAIARCGE